MEIFHALRGLSINGRQTMNNKSNPDKNEEGTDGQMEEKEEEESGEGDRKRNRLKTLPPKPPKKTVVSKSNSKKQSKTIIEDPLSVNRSQSLGGYYSKAESDKGSTGDLPISRKSSLSSLTSLIHMSPRLFPRFGSKSGGGGGSTRKRSNNNSNVSLSPHRENACTNEFYPKIGSSRTSSRCGSPAPSECQSLPSGRCRSPDLFSTSDRNYNPIGNGYHPEMYLDPNQGKRTFLIAI
jgi:hypothetical protein